MFLVFIQLLNPSFISWKKFPVLLGYTYLYSFILFRILLVCICFVLLLSPPPLVRNFYDWLSFGVLWFHLIHSHWNPVPWIWHFPRGSFYHDPLCLCFGISISQVILLVRFSLPPTAIFQLNSYSLQRELVCSSGWDLLISVLSCRLVPKQTMCWVLELWSSVPPQLQKQPQLLERITRQVMLENSGAAHVFNPALGMQK